MNSPVGSGGPVQPILTPLAGRRRFPSLGNSRLPPAAAPVAVTLLGAVALVVAMGAWLREDALRQSTAPFEGAVVVESSSAEPAPEPVESAATAPDAGFAAPTPEAAELTETIADEAAPKAADVADASSADVGGSPSLAEANPASVEEPASGGKPGFDIAAEELIADTANDLIGRAEEPEADGAFASVAAADTDPGLTAAIPSASPGALESEVAVAVTEEEIAALEARQSREVAEDLGETAAVDLEYDTPLRSAIATKWVNMRAGPADEAEVLMVVPALAEIQAEDDCDWCAVSYDGQAGFIYKNFISYRDETDAVEGEAAAADG